MDVLKRGADKKHIIWGRGISSFDLRVIALVSMLIDHCGVCLVNYDTMLVLYWICRGIGRLSFPIFCFLIVEGFHHTSNIKKYAIRLAVFAVISEVPYDLAFYGKALDFSGQNVFVTLLIGLIVIWLMDMAGNAGDGIKGRHYEMYVKYGGDIGVKLLIVSAGCILAGVLKSTYEYAGVLLMVMFYLLKEKKFGHVLANAVFNIGFYGGVQSLGVLSSIPMALYNGKPGNKSFKYVFYAFYPIHLLILAMMQ